MNPSIVRAVPDGPLFDDVLVSVVRVYRDPWIPDYGEPLLDMALVQVEKAMSGEQRQSLEDLRWWLDWPSVWEAMGFEQEPWDGTPSDVAVAAILNHPQSPFGLQYDSPLGWSFVTWRQHVYERVGDVMYLLKDGEE